MRGRRCLDIKSPRLSDDGASVASQPCSLLFTGLNGHKRGSSCRTYTHSLGVVTPNVIIIYCRYGIGAPIGPGTQAHTFRRYVGYVGFECFLPQARLCPHLMWCVSGSDSVIHRDRPNRPAQGVGIRRNVPARPDRELLKLMPNRSKFGSNFQVFTEIRHRSLVKLPCGTAVHVRLSGMISASHF